MHTHALVYIADRDIPSNVSTAHRLQSFRVVTNTTGSTAQLELEMNRLVLGVTTVQHPNLSVIVCKKIGVDLYAPRAIRASGNPWNPY